MSPVVLFGLVIGLGGAAIGIDGEPRRYGAMFLSMFLMLSGFALVGLSVSENARILELQQSGYCQGSIQISPELSRGLSE